MILARKCKPVSCGIDSILQNVSHIQINVSSIYSLPSGKLVGYVPTKYIFCSNSRGYKHMFFQKLYTRNLAQNLQITDL